MSIITSALTMAVHANFEKHHQISIDPRMLSSLKKPSLSVISIPSISLVIGDLTRFSDMFNSVVTPNHNDEIKKFMSEYKMFLGDSKANLSNYLFQIER